MKCFFVTGTDTEVGKTFVSRAMLTQFKNRRLKTAAFKPVASGCENTPDGLRNDDALTLQATSSLPLDYEWVNPFAFEAPIAPHLAAAEAGISIDINQLVEAQQRLSALAPDVLLVEGAGGWRLPLGEGQFMSDFVIRQNMPVILVVGMRLGCLNHALLTAEAIRRDGLPLAGWVANQVDVDMPLLAENQAFLKAHIDAPLLGCIPRLSNPDMAARYLDLTPII
ncbi:dethiobiotin synthase [Bowmanella pacifica]|uniref:ATP-dependent dethiobiotin synthetase BioD n=1 Tax=Bowmanella pacifica TaxID=502051 RepID=A0A917Z0T1_9ALTE|nr:dethiobiotin synthase [Bowmanella pacifica]GGO69789.1 ATP-dependent dethiobiotin synthetase BioD [Bowmanella pacifica]